MIFLIPFAIGDFSYQIDNIGDIDLLLPVGVVIYILSMIICFVVDSYYNPKIKGVKKLKLAIGAFLFYFILYFVNVFLSLFIGMMHMFANWG